MSLKTRRCQRPFNRSGISLLELIASAAVMVVIMTFVTSLCFRVNQVWKDIRHQRVATSELSNHLGRLTVLSADDAEEELKILKPSSFIAQTLPDVSLTGEMVDSELGKQITLQLDWRRPIAGKPVELVGWLVGEAALNLDLPDDGEPNDEDDATQDASSDPDESEETPQ